MIVFASSRACSPIPTWPPRIESVADGGTAGNAGLRGDHGVFADLDVVRDLDEIVEFRSAPDDGGFQRAAVDAGVGADLDVVFDDDSADLRELHICDRRPSQIRSHPRR